MRKIKLLAVVLIFIFTLLAISINSESVVVTLKGKGNPFATLTKEGYYQVECLGNNNNECTLTLNIPTVK